MRQKQPFYWVYTGQTESAPNGGKNSNHKRLSVLKSAADEPISDRCVATAGAWEPDPSKRGSKEQSTHRKEPASQTLTGRSEWAVLSSNEDVRLEEVLVIRK